MNTGPCETSFGLDKDIKDRTQMGMVKRKKYKFRQGDIIDVEEFHDGNYGGPGRGRSKRRKPTEEQMQIVNALNKAKRCRQRLLEYFSPGDVLATWTYNVKDRPPDMKAAGEDFSKAMRYVRREFKKRGFEVFWIRNIEKGTKGAWHIHLVINEIGDTVSIIQKAWKKGGTWAIQIRDSQFHDEDFSKLANYVTKDEHTTEKKKDGTDGKARLKESSYSSSRNMPLPEPKVDKLVRWKDEPKPQKGYYIANIYEGINPVTGYRYRRYTMIRVKRREENEKSRYLHRRGQLRS